MSEVLQHLSDALAAMAEAAAPSVVRVDARRRLPASGIVWSADGIILTAHHVVQKDENIRVGLPNGDAVPAALVGRDPTTDLAVLHAQATGLTVPPWANLDNLRVGHLVLALGRPGRTVRATLVLFHKTDLDFSLVGAKNFCTALSCRFLACTTRC